MELTTDADSAELGNNTASFAIHLGNTIVYLLALIDGLQLWWLNAILVMGLENVLAGLAALLTGVSWDVA